MYYFVLQDCYPGTAQLLFSGLVLVFAVVYVSVQLGSGMSSGMQTLLGNPPPPAKLPEKHGNAGLTHYFFAAAA